MDKVIEFYYHQINKVIRSMSYYNEIIERNMPISISEFYECDNPDCRLRFPGYGGQPKWNRCPACRSRIHLVATVQNVYETDDLVRIQQRRQVDGLLDNIRSTWNVGSMFRTSDGIGIQKLYLCGITPTPENPKVGKTSLGAEKSIPWEKSNNGVQLANLLKSKGYILWALECLPGAIPLFQMDLESKNSPIVLIVGNEVSGVDPGIIEVCDKVISIPMLGKKGSYNVAVAFGIAASFLLYRQSLSQESLNIFPRT
jgi:23S rRNA (guanosine2251-2'-O)-methyltransferase